MEPAEEKKEVEKHETSKKPVTSKEEVKPVAPKVEKPVEKKVEPVKKEAPVVEAEVKTKPEVKSEPATSKPQAEPAAAEEKEG